MDIVLIILGIIFLFMLVPKNKTLQEIYMITSFYDVDLEIWTRIIIYFKI
jgi:hypothetical protein